MRKLLSLIALMLLVPAATFAQAQQTAQNFSRQGIFGCSRNAAALSGSVGAFSATGGVYVPVADYTVELNTGTLVYLECVLRGIVDRESESANAAQIQKVVQNTVAGRDGNPYFASNQRAEYLQVQDKSALSSLQNPAYISAMKPEIAQVVQRAEAQSYMQQTRAREAALKCPSSGDIQEEDGFMKMMDPACYTIGAFNIYDRLRSEDNTQDLVYVKNELDWGDGFYAMTETNENGDRVILTPSAVNKEQTMQALTSGFRRIENANNVDQMVGALYAGLGVQTLTGSGGLLRGLTTAIGNSPAYLSRMTAESSAGLRNAAANAALQILAGARAVESQYNQVVSSIANTLTNAINQIKGMENQCWNLIIYNTTAKHVCVNPPTGNTCTDAAGNTIKIATTTQFSTALIDAQIKPTVTPVVQNVQKSQTALTLIDQLIAGVTNTTSLDAQRLALVQLDQLVSQGKLHVQADVTAAQQQQGAVTDAVAQLIEQTKTLWADNTDPNVGWCNVNNQAVIDMWSQKWR